MNRFLLLACCCWAVGATASDDCDQWSPISLHPHMPRTGPYSSIVPDPFGTYLPEQYTVLSQVDGNNWNVEVAGRIIGLRFINDPPFGEHRECVVRFLERAVSVVPHYVLRMLPEDTKIVVTGASIPSDGTGRTHSAIGAALGVDGEAGPGMTFTHEQMGGPYIEELCSAGSVRIRVINLYRTLIHELGHVVDSTTKGGFSSQHAPACYDSQKKYDEWDSRFGYMHDEDNRFWGKSFCRHLANYRKGVCTMLSAYGIHPRPPRHWEYFAEAFTAWVMYREGLLNDVDALRVHNSMREEVAWFDELVERRSK